MMPTEAECDALIRRKPMHPAMGTDGEEQWMDDAAALLRRYRDAAPSVPAQAEDGRAGWLAQFVIDRMGGTNDLPAWVYRSAQYYEATVHRAETAESALASLRSPVGGATPTAAGGKGEG